MGFGKEGALYPLGASWLVVDSLVHEVAVLGEDAQEAFLAYYADEEDSLEDWGETAFLFPTLGFVDAASKGEVYIGDCLLELLTQQIH